MSRFNVFANVKKILGVAEQSSGLLAGFDSYSPPNLSAPEFLNQNQLAENFFYFNEVKGERQEKLKSLLSAENLTIASGIVTEPSALEFHRWGQTVFWNIQHEPLASFPRLGFDLPEDLIATRSFLWDLSVFIGDLFLVENKQFKWAIATDSASQVEASFIHNRIVLFDVDSNTYIDPEDHVLYFYKQCTLPENLREVDVKIARMLGRLN